MLCQRLILLSIAIALTCSGLAQGHEILESFTIRQVDNHIQIDFAVKGGASCEGVRLERSSDNLEYYQIVEILGICGGSEFTEYYTFIDDDPLEYEQNYYRLELGNQGYSESISIHFVRLVDGYRVFPNPVDDWCVIRLENPQQQDLNFALYNQSGNVIDRAEGLNTNEVFLDTGSFAPGMYIFQFTGKSDFLVTGRIIVNN